MDRRVANWQQVTFGILRELGCKKLTSTVWNFLLSLPLLLFTSSFKLDSNTQFWHQFGINVAVTNGFIVHGIVVENLVFFVSEKHCIWCFRSKRVGNLMDGGIHQ